MNRLKYIDGLKGWCAISVCILHFLLMFANDGFIGWKCLPEAAENPFAYYFVYETDNKIVGYMNCWISDNTTILNFCVDEEYRRKGYGKSLIEEMEKRASEMGVNTIRLDTFSWQGKEFYEALNYEIVGSYESNSDGYAEYFFLKRI